MRGMATPRRLQCFRSLWGTPRASQLARGGGGASEGDYASRLIAHIRQQGYDGVEASLDDLEALGGPRHVQTLLDAHELQLIVGVYSGWVDYEPHNLHQQFEGVQAHVDRFRAQLETVCGFTRRPVRVNAHSGSDHWRESEQLAFMEQALKVQIQLGLDDILGHETHRGRMLHSPWPTRALLEEFPSLKLTLDFSHWCVVAERLLDAPQENEWLLQSVVPRVRHVHGRVGTAQVAQLPFPHDAELSSVETDRFQRLWDAIWHYQATSNETCDGISTFTPEYGPIPYAPCDPDDRTREAYNVDELCAQQAASQREKFELAIRR